MWVIPVRQQNKTECKRLGKEDTKFSLFPCDILLIQKIQQNLQKNYSSRAQQYSYIPKQYAKINWISIQQQNNGQKKFKNIS